MADLARMPSCWGSVPMVEKYPEMTIVIRKIVTGINRLETCLNFVFNPGSDNFLGWKNGIAIIF